MPIFSIPPLWVKLITECYEDGKRMISVDTTEPLGLTAFETVFRSACKSVQWKMDPPGSSTRRFVDLVVQAGNDPERRLSLKSTSALNLSKTRAHISKLTEAAWIQDERTARNRQRRTLDLFEEYQQAVDAIIMLSAFRKRGEVPSRYQLIEIPTSIFDSVRQAPVEVFQRDAPIIDCRIGGETVARVAIDRSDAKITVLTILLSACTVHAEWTLPVPLGFSPMRAAAGSPELT